MDKVGQVCWSGVDDSAHEKGPGTVPGSRTEGFAMYTITPARVTAVGMAVVAVGAVTLAGPAAASRPDPLEDVQNVQSGQAARVHADLTDLKEQLASVPGSPSPGSPSPVDLPLLQIGLGVAAAAAFAAGAARRRQRPHGAQPA